ncbi:MAG: hypothetical protein J0L99_09735 [Chitinophagales bacterium]|nr:hypothetical protein [Chitinophagales bacterium]
MVIKNREERSSAIWRFIGVASIPLLLLFISGYFLGNTAGNEQGKLRESLTRLENSLDTCKSRVDNYRIFFGKADSLLNKIKDGAEQLSESLDAAVEAGTSVAIGDWDDKNFSAYRLLKREIDELELDALQRNKSDQVFITSFEMIRTVNELTRAKLDLMRQQRSGKLNRNQLDSLDVIQNDIEKRLQELDTKTAITTAQNKVISLQAELDVCKAEVARIKGAPTAAGGVDRAKIEAQLSIIKGEIIPNLQATWIGNDKTRINNLREKLRTQVSEIERALGK